MFDFLQKQEWYVIAVLAIFVYIFLGYFIALLVYILSYRFFKREFKRIKIQQSYTSPKIIKHELSYSFMTLLIHGLVGSIAIFAFYKGNTKIYSHIAKFGYWYWIVSIFAMILLHDTYFYWTHRFLHIKEIYPIMHKVHHRSVNPSPWAAYSSHPLEALIAGLFFPIMAFILPSHWLAMSVFIIYGLFMSVMGHSGFEVYSKTFRNSEFGKLLNTSTHHNQHHEFFHGNYGLYFNIWDRIMKTERRNYKPK